MTWIKPTIGGLLGIQLLMSTTCGSKVTRADKGALVGDASKVTDEVEAVDAGIDNGDLEGSLRSTSSTPPAQSAACHSKGLSKTKFLPSDEKRPTDPAGSGTS
ncbi:MAG: hypothetical protein K2X94_00210 [Amoebophilaceae bacterium]|nr:hypothetical protein [Amoebophilaceae bacterium]